MPEVIVAPADAAARERALDIQGSVIVQAPAGSGKTDLLTRRFLRLLAVVDEPEQILAITFTRAATAEMRSRILSDLESAARRSKPTREQAPRWELARAALAQSERRKWDILNQPHRLAIETIDSLCLRIARERPLLAGLGGQVQPTEQADPLYAMAAHRTLGRLGGPNALLNAALAHFLDLRDNNLAGCESLLARMLATRDQWQRILPLSREMSEEDWEIARTRLEAPFRREVRRVLDEAYRVFAEEQAIARQLLELANYSLSKGNQRLASITGFPDLSSAMSPEHWLCIHDLTIRDGQWRKTVDKRHGFPSRSAEERQRRNAMISLLTWLRNSPQLLSVLCAIHDLPPASYSDQQWTTLRHMLTVLRQAIAELTVVFAERNAVDFTQLNLDALNVLRESQERPGGIGTTIRHLLIDEFQDTSQIQLEIVEALIAAWDLSEHCTCFLVGDPMQSIYMFRQAEVEIFSDVRERGIGPEDNRIVCTPVQLSMNFRSHSGLTGPLNEFFSRIGDAPTQPGAAVVRFAEALPASEEPREPSVYVQAQIIGEGERQPTQDEIRSAREEEARRVLQILGQQLPLIERARQRSEEYRVAVLVRARPHLLEIVPLLRSKGIPFRAVEIEHLSERQEILDLRSLTRALLHPAERIAWLSILRAPWCGLTLADLHRLTGSDDRDFAKRTVPELIESRRHLLSQDGQERLARVSELLRSALDGRWNGSFASWIERTWRTLGGPAFLDEAAVENAETFFSLLDSVSPVGLTLLTREFDIELDRLFAQPDPQVSERCGIQLMTIHRAKGLGFEVVVVPGLDRKSSSDAHPLLCSLERRNPWNSRQDEFLVAPIGPKGDDSHPLYKWVMEQRNIRFDEERKRLFYVACTRARRELHLLGTAILNGEQLKPGEFSGLLETAWPALRDQFESQLRKRRNRRPVQKTLQFPAPGVLEQVAAAADSQAGPKRLPRDFELISGSKDVIVSPAPLQSGAGQQVFQRPEGTRRARVIGSAVHVMLQRLGPDLASLNPDTVRLTAAALLRGYGLSGESHLSATDAVVRTVLACAADPVCRWILAAHPEAQSEASWSGYSPGLRLQTLRADRVFRAGAEPLASGSDCFWIVDYKTGAPRSADPQRWLAQERLTYAPQLTAYGRTARALHGTSMTLRLGLYYPELSVLDWWDPDLS